MWKILHFEKKKSLTRNMQFKVYILEINLTPFDWGLNFAVSLGQFNIKCILSCLQRKITFSLLCMCICFLLLRPLWPEYLGCDCCSHANTWPFPWLIPGRMEKTEMCLSEFCTFFEEEFVRQAFSLSIVWSSSCQYISGCRCQWAKGISSKSFHSDMKIKMFEQLKMAYLT